MEGFSARPQGRSKPNGLDRKARFLLARLMRAYPKRRLSVTVTIMISAAIIMAAASQRMGEPIVTGPTAASFVGEAASAERVADGHGADRSSISMMVLSRNEYGNDIFSYLPESGLGGLGEGGGAAGLARDGAGSGIGAGGEAADPERDGPGSGPEARGSDDGEGGMADGSPDEGDRTYHIVKFSKAELILNARDEALSGQGEEGLDESGVDYAYHEDRVGGITVNVMVDGEVRSFTVGADADLDEILEAAELTLSDLDRIEGSYGDFTDANSLASLNLDIIKVEERITKEYIPIPFDSILRTNANLDKGTKRVVSEGVNGTREITWKSVYENGERVSLTKVGDYVSAQPVSRIVEEGTRVPATPTPTPKPTPKAETTPKAEASPNGDAGASPESHTKDDFTYVRVLEMKATAYTSSYEDTGKRPGDPLYGMTYTGMKAQYGVVAVDPKVIPLHSRLYIEIPGSNDYGFAVAGDIGGAVKGNIIDLYFETKEEARAFTTKKVIVYILD